MRSLAWIIAAVTFVSPAAAQVITGESIYEDNFAHTPPMDRTRNGDARSGSESGSTTAPPPKSRERR